MCALLSLWSSAVFRKRPSTGFSATLLLFGLGSIAGPAFAGALADGYGLTNIFLSVAILSVLTALIQPNPERAIRQPGEPTRPTRPRQRPEGGDLDR